MTDILQSYNTEISANKDNDFKDLNNKYLNYIYTDYVNSQALKDSIDTQAIIDIKILNTDRLNEAQIESLTGIDLSTYEKQSLNTENTLYLYIKRLEKISNFKNLLDVSNLIVDVHLYNHLWCAYLDINFPKLSFSETQILNKAEINFGYDYCNKFYNDIPAPFYNDGYKRTSRINFIEDRKLSKLDFYSKSIIDSIEINSKDLTKESVSGRLEPVLIYEKYFRGLGCLKMNQNDSIDNHLKKLKAIGTLKYLSLGTLVIEIISHIMLILCIYYRKKESNRVVGLCFLIILGLVGLNVFFNFIGIINSQSTYSYFYNYEYYCQNDFSNGLESIKTNAMESRYKNKMIAPFVFNLLLLIIHAITVFFLIFGFFGNCCCLKKDESDNRQVFELRTDDRNTHAHSIDNEQL